MVVLSALIIVAAWVVHTRVVPLEVLFTWPRPASLYVASEPEGASVKLDGVPLPYPTPAKAEVRRDRAEYDVIFLDPPFRSGYGERLLPLLPPRVAPHGWVYYECGEPIQWPSGWSVEKEGHAGQVVYQLVKRT